MRIIFYFLFLTTFIFSCKNDPATQADGTAVAVDTTATAAAETAAPAAGTSNNLFGTISYVSADKIALKEGKDIVLPKADDKETTTIYLTTHAATLEGKTSLSPEGQIAAGQLTNILTQAGLQQVYVEGNASMQTGLVIAKENQCEFNMFMPKNYETLLATITKNFAGKKVMVVAPPATINAMLEKLGGNKDNSIGNLDVKHIFVALAKHESPAMIMQLTY